MAIIVTTKKYITQMKKEQRTTPPADRKIIPSVEDFAANGNVHTKSVYGFLARSDHRRVDLHIVEGIIKAFRSYGHDTQVSDLIEFVGD